MAEFNILETLELVGKAKTREEKRQVLADRDNFATRALLQLNYHPDVKWHLPAGAPPYTPGQVADSTPNSLHFEVKKLDYYVDPSPHDLPMLRRESMFVELLERVDPNDAKLIIAVKDRKLSYKGLSYKLVKDTWPDLLPDVEEKEDTPPVKKQKVVKKGVTPTTNSKGVDW
jgi:hypothetical protein|tara:strand:- start:2487 stop:3002 length:516 start_codon:yes stop_codon:yes gene_type:complete